MKVHVLGLTALKLCRKKLAGWVQHGVKKPKVITGAATHRSCLGVRACKLQVSQAEFGVWCGVVGGGGGYKFASWRNIKASLALFGFIESVSHCDWQVFQDPFDPF